MERKGRAGLGPRLYGPQTLRSSSAGLLGHLQPAKVTEQRQWPQGLHGPPGAAPRPGQDTAWTDSTCACGHAHTRTCTCMCARALSRKPPEAVRSSLQLQNVRELLRLLGLGSSPPAPSSQCPFALCPPRARHTAPPGHDASSSALFHLRICPPISAGGWPCPPTRGRRGLCPAIRGHFQSRFVGRELEISER